MHLTFSNVVHYQEDVQELESAIEKVMHAKYGWYGQSTTDHLRCKHCNGWKDDGFEQLKKKT